MHATMVSTMFFFVGNRWETMGKINDHHGEATMMIHVLDSWDTELETERDTLTNTQMWLANSRIPRRFLAIKSTPNDKGFWQE